MTHKLTAGTFFGTKLRSHMVEGFGLSEWQYNLGATAPRHSHENAYLNLVLQGGHRETLTKGEVVSGPAVLVFHPPEEVHGGDICCSDTRIFSMEIAPPRLERLRNLGLVPEERLELPGAVPVWLATRLHREFTRMDALSPLAIEGIALELLVELGRRPETSASLPPPRWLLRARDLLHDRFAENLSLEEIAQTVGVHPDHLVHTFRGQYRCTIGEYVRRLRIEFACRQMTASEMPLAQIALAAGFVDQSHFTRTFKRLIGMTPTEFQRRSRSSL